MDKRLSIYLDALRFFAALIVFTSHLAWHRISGGFLWRIGGIGHDGVIIFFVLSGYVISVVASTKEDELRTYAVSRLARLYSVLIPALVLTLVADTIGMAQNPTLYDQTRETLPLLRLLSAAFFLSTLWHLDFSLLSNDPYWSLPYEFWYYVMFGCATFLRGKVRWVACGMAALIAGPNIMLMFPLWLLGAAAYRFKSQLRTPVAVFASSMITLAVVLYADSHHLIARAAINSLPPGFSMVDFVTGFAITANIIAARQLKIALPAPVLIRFCAGFTFALYLFHLPLLFLVASYLPSAMPVPYKGAILTLSVIVFVVPVGTLTERSKMPLRKWIGNLLRSPVVARS